MCNFLGFFFESSYCIREGFRCQLGRYENACGNDLYNVWNEENIQLYTNNLGVNGEIYNKKKQKISTY